MNSLNKAFALASLLLGSYLFAIGLDHLMIASSLAVLAIIANKSDVISNVETQGIGLLTLGIFLLGLSLLLGFNRIEIQEKQ
jgi:hypothetical protein